MSWPLFYFYNLLLIFLSFLFWLYIIPNTFLFIYIFAWIFYVSTKNWTTIILKTIILYLFIYQLLIINKKQKILSSSCSFVFLNLFAYLPELTLPH
jgi:hypothetical protein